MNIKPLLPIPILLAVGGGAYWWWQKQEPPQDTSRLTLYGNVDIRQADLAFDASGHVAEIRVQEGDRVQPGQVLARLRPDKLEAALEAAQATVAAQEQALAKLKAGSRPQEIRQARAQTDALAAKTRMARITYQRLLKMGQQRLAAPEEIDQARAAADAAEAEVRAAEEAYALVVAGPRAEDIAVAEAGLAARRAELALARERLADATLLAPAPGIVRDRILEPGDMASPQTPVLTLALNASLWVRIYVPESDLGRVRSGMAAEIRTDSYPHKTYRGWVGFISPTAEFTPKSVETPDLRTRLVYQARVFVCNPQDELRLGMPATVTLALDRPPEPDAGSSHRCAE
ncbi:MAG: efflux RND transporter periplasmic adaptor subunit [Candidatus Competibacter sp.]|nr:efflux RND transporter periplasmic adaptor subunit [Candidatus Competibacter sp.]MDG4583958.1 efflux RND transporter periplasmic adaptor subunit [Candidatus Competibacter sp.]